VVGATSNEGFLFCIILRHRSAEAVSDHTRYTAFNVSYSRTQCQRFHFRQEKTWPHGTDWKCQ